MKCADAMQWLDEHGGRWCVRATQATCVVIATLGQVQVLARSQTLNSADVGDALITVVQELQHMTQSIV